LSNLVVLHYTELLIKYLVEKIIKIERAQNSLLEFEGGEGGGGGCSVLKPNS
jgi:hypothetical protein